MRAFAAWSKHEGLVVWRDGIFRMSQQPSPSLLVNDTCTVGVGPTGELRPRRGEGAHKISSTELMPVAAAAAVPAELRTSSAAASLRIAKSG